MATSTNNLFARYAPTAAKIPSPSILEGLFPAPASFPPSTLSPQALPGTTSEAERALLAILKHNHQNHHIFFNDEQHDK